MPIVASSLGAASQALANDLNALLASTVTQTRLVVINTVTQCQVAFRTGGVLATQARLVSPRFGELGLTLSHLVGVRDREDGKKRLYSLGYNYGIGPYGFDDPTLRWDYVRYWPYQVDADSVAEIAPDDMEKWARHHLQGTESISLGADTFKLNELHLPTGFVCIEDIIRFCLHDLGVEPLADDWHDRLNASYERFRRDYVVD